MDDKSLVTLSHLDTMLAQATRINDITDVRDRARALQVYAQNIKASKEQTIDIATVRIKAERKAGQVLQSMQMNEGARGAIQKHTGGEDTRPPVHLSVPTLEELGISKYSSSRWQLIALIPDDVFNEELLRCTEVLREPSTEQFARIGRAYKGDAMQNGKQALKGSPSRDAFKHWHKTLHRKFYACDIDFCLVEKSPPRIAAVLDYKRGYDRVTFAEVVAYNHLLRVGIPVYIVQSDTLEVFTIYQYTGGDHTAYPDPVVHMVQVADGLSPEQFGQWEQSIRG